MTAASKFHPSVRFIGASGHQSYIPVFGQLEAHGVRFDEYPTKTIEMEVRDGNINPVYSHPGNCFGRPNQGEAWWYGEIERTDLELHIIPSVGGKDSAAYYTLIGRIEALDTTLSIDGYELNLSCPHVSERDGETKSLSKLFGSNPEAVESLIRGSKRAANGKPVIAKLGPSDNYVEVALAASRAGADYIAVSNTLPGYDLDIFSGAPTLSGGGGGSSGPMLKLVAQRMVKDIYKVLDHRKTGIIAYGGGESWKDLITFHRLGADIVGAGTFAYRMNMQEMTEETGWMVNGRNAYLCARNIGLDELVGEAHRVDQIDMAWIGSMPPQFLEERKMKYETYDIGYRPHKIVEIIKHNDTIRSYVFEPAFEVPQPGQFTKVWMPNVGEVPLTLRSYDTITVRQKGSVTNAMANLRKGGYLLLEGKLGNGFPIGNGVKYDTVGGGDGSIPLISLAETGSVNEMYIGARNAKEILFLDQMRTMKDNGIIKDFHIATEDGSLGRKGFVTRWLNDISGDNPLAVVGPEPMIVAVAEEMDDFENTYVSLERRMKCFASLCGSCHVNGLKVCSEGPVFPYDKVRPGLVA